MEGLTIGRVVHFVDTTPEREHHAAVVTGVSDLSLGIVSLTIFYDGHEGHARNVRHSNAHECAKPEPNTWHWIERA